MKPKRDDTGRVITKDRNALSNPTSKVETDLFKPLKYIIDPFERKEMFEKKEREINHQKRGDEKFRSMSHGNILFTNHKSTYGCDPEAE